MSEKNPTSNPGSKKYALQFTLPNGDKYIATVIKGKFGLIPKSENSVEGIFLAWDTPDELNKFVRDLKKLNREEFERVWKFSPKVIVIEPMQ